MKIKNGSSLSGISLVMRRALVEADKIWRKYGQELVVTSGTDGEHSAGSLHYYGYAVDLRIRYFEPDIAKKACHELMSVLHPDGYLVYLEPDHIHVEYRRILDKE